MLISILDLGSNSFHWLVAETDGRSVCTRYQRKRHVRLANSMQGGALNADGLARALEAVSELSGTVPAPFREAKVVAVATGVVRQASNGRALLQAIEQATGIRVELIDGKREARLAYLGALSDRRTLDALAELEPNPPLVEERAASRMTRREPTAPEPAAGSGDQGRYGVRAAVVDLGGGSLELAVGCGLEVQRAFSVPRGLLTATEQAPLGRAALGRAALERVGQMEPELGRAALERVGQMEPELGRAAGWVVEGLVRQLPRGAVEARHWVAACGIAREVRALMERLALSAPAGAIDVELLAVAWPRWAQWGPARLQELGVSRDRISTLPLGAAILASLCRRFGVGRLVVAGGGLRQGLALESCWSASPPRPESQPRELVAVGAPAAQRQLQSRGAGSATRA